MSRILDSISSPEDLRKLELNQLETLAAEIREELISTVSKTGGHLASNLGIVELTIAMHRLFDSPRDKIVFDVGHQCYVHKILTGRLNKFSTLRQEGGLSGFPRPEESEHDPFICGHSSTSVSSALGLARANTLRGDSYFTAAVIGDGSLCGGMVYEALNNAGQGRDRLIIFLNDNKMSISKNVGGMARHLAIIRSRMGYYKFKTGVDKFVRAIPLIGPKLRNWLFRSKSLVKNAIYKSTIFEDMGIAYLGPVDGHNIRILERTISVAKAMKRPVIIHTHTVKGKGYSFAEKNPKNFHGVSSFDIETGDIKLTTDSFSYIFGQELTRLAREDERICAITAAMTEGTGLLKFREEFRHRFFDVGIAEQHAITFAGGLAGGGLIPVFAVYSSFLQRGYDQIIHDSALQGNKMIFAIDRAGIVGEDGETHQGIFDLSFLSGIPGLTVLTPFDYDSFCRLLQAAIYDIPGVVAIRYPRGRCAETPVYSAWRTAVSGGREIKKAEIEAPPLEGLYDIYSRGEVSSDKIIVTFGRTVSAALEACNALYEKNINADLLIMLQVHPLPDGLISALLKYSRIYIFEEGVKSGGVAEHITTELALCCFKGKIEIHTLPDEFIPHAATESIIKRYHLDSHSIAEIVEKNGE